MDVRVTRRTALKAAAGGAVAALPTLLPARADAGRADPGCVSGHRNGSMK